jgi:hypothetical protein
MTMAVETGSMRGSKVQPVSAVLVYQDEVFIRRNRIREKLEERGLTVRKEVRAGSAEYNFLPSRVVVVVFEGAQRVDAKQRAAESEALVAEQRALIDQLRAELDEAQSLASPSTAADDGDDASDLLRASLEEARAKAKEYLDRYKGANAQRGGYKLKLDAKVAEVRDLIEEKARQADKIANLTARIRDLEKRPALPGAPTGPLDLRIRSVVDALQAMVTTGLMSEAEAWGKVTLAVAGPPRDPETTHDARRTTHDREKSEKRTTPASRRRGRKGGGS